MHVALDGNRRDDPAAVPDCELLELARRHRRAVRPLTAIARHDLHPRTPADALPVQEHPGDMEVTRAWQVMSAIHNYIANNKDKDGNLPIKDDKTGETLPLQFVEIHQPVRHLKKEGEYFVCTDFRKPGSQDEYYDIDFWVNQKTGKLEVDNVKVHKVPVQEDGVWTQVPRYTFEGMDFDTTN